MMRRGPGRNRNAVFCAELCNQSTRHRCHALARTVCGAPIVEQEFRCDAEHHFSCKYRPRRRKHHAYSYRQQHPAWRSSTWNGSDRTTTIVDAPHVTVAIPASDLNVAGKASVVATNPGASDSNTLQTTINY